MSKKIGTELLERGLVVETEFREGKGIRVTVKGDLDNESTQDFNSTLSSLLPKASQYGGLVIDLAGLRYISSSGAGTLASIFIAARTAKVACRIESVPANVRTVLEMLGLWSWLAPTPSRSDLAQPLKESSSP